MKRRRSPVTEKKAPESAELRADRARKIQELRRLEWEFDHNPTLEVVDELHDRRIELSRIEGEIAAVTQEAAAQALLDRVEGIRIGPILERINTLAS